MTAGNSKTHNHWLCIPLTYSNFVSFQLAGRILLIFLFLGFMLQGKWSFTRFLVSLIGLAACGMVAVGFKAKWSAAFLVITLSTFNVFVNNWWSIHSAHPQRDFLKLVSFIIFHHQILTRFA